MSNRIYNRAYFYNGQSDTAYTNFLFYYDFTSSSWGTGPVNPYSASSSPKSPQPTQGAWDGNRFICRVDTSGTGLNYVSFCPSGNSWDNTAISVANGDIPYAAACDGRDFFLAWFLRTTYWGSFLQLTHLPDPEGGVYNTVIPSYNNSAITVSGAYLQWDYSGLVYAFTPKDVVAYSITGDFFLNIGTTGLPSTAILIKGAICGSIPYAVTFERDKQVRSRVFKLVGGSWVQQGTGRAITASVPTGSAWWHLSAQVFAPDQTMLAVFYGGSLMDQSATFNVNSQTWTAITAPPNANYQVYTGGGAFTTPIDRAVIWKDAASTPITFWQDLGTFSNTAGMPATEFKFTATTTFASGVTVSIGTPPNSDIAALVSISSTSSGPWSASFTTGAINSGDTVSVWAKIAGSSSVHPSVKLLGFVLTPVRIA